jgi:hypothetical protein
MHAVFIEISLYNTNLKRLEAARYWLTAGLESCRIIRPYIFVGEMVSKVGGSCFFATGSQACICLHRYGIKYSPWRVFDPA